MPRRFGLLVRNATELRDDLTHGAMVPRTVSLRLEEKRVGAVVPNGVAEFAIHAEDVRILRKTFARVQAHTKPATPSSTPATKAAG